jgi:Ca2+-binding EF-hand superfamily protein
LTIQKTTTALALSLALAIPLAAQKPRKQVEKKDPVANIDGWFAKYDDNRDGHLTVQEFALGRTLFAAVDLDKNGVLTREEAIDAMTKKQAEPTVNLRKLDTDGDGFVTRREWDGDQAGFDRLDADNDGVLSKKDRDLIRNRERADQRMAAYDKNKDGIISQDEWPGSEETFRQQDGDRNGKITVDELVEQP